MGQTFQLERMEREMEQLERLYEEYLNTVDRLQRERKPFEGRFGLGGGPATHPCHRQFAQDVEAALANVETQQLEQALRYIYQSPLQHRGQPLVYWMFVALHAATLSAIPRLARAQARELGWWYETTYPSRERIFCQERVITALKRVK